jgi:hypothetical protein
MNRLTAFAYASLVTTSLTATMLATANFAAAQEDSKIPPLMEQINKGNWLPQ